jgi:NADPH-dependent glutamate synthase beta subunit-like oxidoreductase
MDFMPPCNSACPAGENIQAWLADAQSGNYFDAFQKILEDNPFPAIMGRVCVKPCEKGCNRNHIDKTVNIHAVERYIGDLAVEKGWQVQGAARPNGKRVLVVGAGPAGLSAAYHLARKGYQVEIYEAASAPGGLMWFGIPEYRLPRVILKAEIDRILALGVILTLNKKVTDLEAEKEKGGFDAVFVGIGAHLNKAENFDQQDPIPVTDAFTFLRQVNEGNPPAVGKHAVVYGGGKLAMYLSRVVRRLGANATVLYPGDRKLMPAYDFEADDAISEGVDVQMLRSIKSVQGKTLTLDINKVEKGKVVPTGSPEIMEADLLVLATGQEGDTQFLKTLEGLAVKDDGTINTDAGRMTGRAGIFAGGDVIGGERSTTIAIGHGKKAAKFIDAYINEQTIGKKEKPLTAGYRRLHMWYKTEAPQAEQEKLNPHVAIRSFDEVVHGLSEPEAKYEAQRCLSCGNCFECDGCYGACPEDAIIKLGPGKRYKFNYNACTGCAVCYEQCPCHAIEMIPEPVNANGNA